MRKTLSRVLASVLVVAVALTAFSLRKSYLKKLNHQAPDDPAWSFNRGSRFAVKARKLSDGAHYLDFNGGKSISVTQYFDLAKSLEKKLPKEIPDDRAIAGVETMRVTVSGYLVEAHFLRDGDKDLHATLSATPDWNSGILNTEIPPGPAYQEARSALWQQVRQNVQAWKGDHFRVDEWTFRKPPRVQVSGYIFMDRQHAHGTTPYEDRAEEEAEERLEEIAQKNRTTPPLDKPDRTMMRGWEIHPVLSFTPLDKAAKNVTVAPDSNDNPNSYSD